MRPDPAPSVAESMARVAEIGLLPVVELPDLKLAEPLFEALSASPPLRSRCARPRDWTGSGYWSRPSRRGSSAPAPCARSKTPPG
jgi:hypothetical protein